jgi:ribosome-associated translation inhibitor RaiA
MQITITGRHLSVTDPIRSYAEERYQESQRYTIAMT